MKYKFRYFVINQYYTHIAKPRNFPEARWITGQDVSNNAEFDIEHYPHCTGEWKEINLSFLTVIWYRFVYGDDWRDQIEYELTDKIEGRK